METLFQDLKYGARMLVKSPAFTAVAVITLALGIGANTAIFTVIDALLLRMLPIQHPEQLVVVGDPARVSSQSKGSPRIDLFSYPLYREIRNGQQVFSGIFASADLRRLMVRTDEPGQSSSAEPAAGRVVTGGYFSTLGVTALRGRVIEEEDDATPGAQPVAVISYGYWKRRFALDPNVLGKTLRLNQHPFTVIGITRPGFEGEVVGAPQDIWVPMAMQEQVMVGRKWLEDPSSGWMQIMGRLKPGVTVEQARASLNVLMKQIAAGPFGKQFGKDDADALRQPLQVEAGGRGLSSLRKDFGNPLLLLMVIVALVLLIAVVNVANLVMARAAARQKEIAVRMAVGAAPRRVVRQLLTESLLLAFLGGAAGLLVASWGVQALLALVLGKSAASQSFAGLAPDARVLGFTAAVCVLTGILFGITPALRALRVELTPTLKDGSRSVGSTGATTSRWRLSQVLVAAQVGLSLLVLFVAGLMVRTMRHLDRVDLGYSREHLLLVNVDPAVYKIDQVAEKGQQLLDQLSRVPGVTAATDSNNGLFSGTESSTTITVPGFVRGKDSDGDSAYDYIGPNYFTTVGIPVLLGREVDRRDTGASARVAVVNENFAKSYFKDQNPIGHKFAAQEDEKPGPPIEIIGVARDARDHGLRAAVRRRFYIPLTQGDEFLGRLNFELRAQGDPELLIPAVRKVFESFDPNLPVLRITSLNDLIGRSMVEQIMVAKLSGFFGALALLLASVGLYGVMSYSVTGRTREIGVRMALGAQPTHVRRMVLREAVAMVLAGVVVGVPAALAGSRALSSMLFGLKPSDPTSMAIAVGILTAVAAIASYIPARRATKVDPMVALRNE
jgi:predicted permease